MFEQSGGVSVADQHVLVASLPDLPVDQLSAVLGQLDHTTLSGVDLAIVLRTQQRLMCWAQAGMAAAQCELAHCPTGSGADKPYLRTEQANAGAADEIALALRLSPISAGLRLSSAAFAYRVTPVAWRAWRDALISDAKVHALEEVSLGCSDQVATALAEGMLSEAITDRAGRTNKDRAVDDVPGVFKRRARRMVMMLDPDAVDRRRTARLEDRHVRVGHDEDGLGYITGANLPVETIAEAEAFIHDLARQIKHRGDPRKLSNIRADVFTALLAGRTADQILAAHRIRGDADEHGDTADADLPYVTPLRPGPYADTPTGADMAGDGSDPSSLAADQAADAEADPDLASAAGLSDTSGGQLALQPLSQLGEPVDPDDRPAESDCGDGADLIFMSDWPTQHNNDDELAGWPAGESPGWASARAEWTSWDQAESPPAGAPPSGPAAGTSQQPKPAPLLATGTGRRPLIELVVPYDLLLGGVTPGEANGFGLIPPTVLRRLIEQAAASPSDWCLTVVDDTGRVVKHARTKHDPTTDQLRFVRARDRSCTFPGCPRKADRCDTDHRHPYEKGGPTCPCNLHPLCRHHHRTKQTNGWAVHRDPATSGTRWTTPHGLTGSNDTDTLDLELYQPGQHTDAGPPGRIDPPGKSDGIAV